MSTVVSLKAMKAPLAFSSWRICCIDRMVPILCWQGPRGLFLTLLLCVLGQMGHAAANPATFSTQELQQLQTVVSTIQHRSLVPPPIGEARLTTVLRAYIQRLDAYGDYLSPKEYAAYLRSQEQDYYGVQMDIQRRENAFFLYPFQDGLAERSGILPGDELLAVDQQMVSGFSVYVVGAMIRNPSEKTVQLTIKSKGRIPRLVSIHRSRTQLVPFRHKQMPLANLLVLSRFLRDTPRALRQLLEKSRQGNEHRPLIIDLRENQGGSLIAAKECAELFVPKGKVLLRLRDREQQKQLVADSGQVSRAPLILLQNQYTASAAEAFILALTRSGRAVSAGRKSYGKGVAQRFIPLADGAALLVTYAEILDPLGHSYDKTGLEPDVYLSDVLMRQDFFSENSLESLLSFIKASKNN